MKPLATALAYVLAGVALGAVLFALAVRPLAEVGAQPPVVNAGVPSPTVPAATTTTTLPPATTTTTEWTGPRRADGRPLVVRPSDPRAEWAERARERTPRHQCRHVDTVLRLTAASARQWALSDAGVGFTAEQWAAHDRRNHDAAQIVITGDCVAWAPGPDGRLP